MESILYPFQKDGLFPVIFWKYLFIPDVLTKIFFFSSANYKEFINDNYFIFLIFGVLTVLSCIYFPIIYVVTWMKANASADDANWSVLAKIYIILSFSSSNVAFIVAGGGVLYVLQ
jgi:hypothetical protein